MVTPDPIPQRKAGDSEEVGSFNHPVGQLPGSPRGVCLGLERCCLSSTGMMPRESEVMTSVFKGSRAELLRDSTHLHTKPQRETRSTYSLLWRLHLPSIQDGRLSARNTRFSWGCCPDLLPARMSWHLNTTFML